MKYLLPLIILSLSFKARAQNLNISAIVFKDASTNQVLKSLNSSVPGVTIGWVPNGEVVVKAANTTGFTLKCSFDGAKAFDSLLVDTGFACPLPPVAQLNGPHVIVTTPSKGVAFKSTYLMVNSSVVIPPPPKPSTAFVCATAACVQAYINNAIAGIAGAPTVLDFGTSSLVDCGTISLDQVQPYVTIKNLTLTGKTTVCNLANTTAKAKTNNLTIDSVIINNGTNSTTLASCSGSSSASIVIYGSANTIQNSTINGGTASGIFLGGSSNTLKDSTFNQVNTFNGNTMTSCSGVLVAGFKGLVAFNTFNTCNGTCIHIAPASYAAPLSSTLGNDVIWGNLVNNALTKSFVGTPYEGDAGAIYAGWNVGNNTNIQWNIIKGLNPNGFGNTVCAGFSCAAGLYFDNNTAWYTAMNNFVDPGNAHYPALKMNPQTLTSNPKDVLTSGNRTVQNNTFIGTPDGYISSTMKIVTAQGQKVMATSPDASCPLTCNNSVVATGVPSFSAGVGSETTLPAPVFLIQK